MFRSSHIRSVWLGVVFLGIAAFFAIFTAYLLVTDHRLTDLGPLGGRESVQPAQDGAAMDGVTTPTAEPTEGPAPALDPIPPDLELSARSALVVHPESDKVLFEQAADEPIQPASTAKIFTALAVLRHASPDEVIEISGSDVVDPVAESSMGLQAGDRVTVHDLLVGLMLPSGNDAANALARVIGERLEVEDDGLSPEERFIQEMNAVAHDLGLSVSTLMHPAGHDREGQVVTARELAVAAEVLLERPSMGPILSMKEAEIQVGGDNSRVITVENTNELLAHQEIFGVKTGTTEDAGQCLVAASREGNGTVISVILGSQDRYADARALLDLPEPTEPESEPEDESTEEPEQ